MLLSLFSLPLLALLTACATDPAVKATCADLPDEPLIGADIDGAGWTDAAAWAEAGTGIQITTGADNGWRLTLVAYVDEEGREAVEALDALPAVFGMGGEGGNATVYPEGGGSLSTGQGGSGTISIAEQRGDDLAGCFAFEALSADGESVSVASGRFLATPSTL